MITHFRGVVLRCLVILSCGGIGFDGIEALDVSPTSKAGVRYPFDVKGLSWENLFRDPSYNVIGRIDTICAWESIVSRWFNTFDLKWMQSTKTLGKLGRTSVHCSINDLI